VSTQFELMVISGSASLQETLATLDSVALISVPTTARALSLLDGDWLPGAVYVEDTLRGTLDDVWAIVRAAMRRQVRVVVNLQGRGAGRASEFQAAGATVIDARTPDAVADQVSKALGTRRRAHSEAIMVAVTAVKGGVGKTLLTAMLAEGLRQRGVSVLVIDNDISNSGIRPTFRIPSTAPTYTGLLGDGLGMAAWTPERLRSCIYQHRESGLDFLLGPEEMVEAIHDLDSKNFYAFLHAVRQLSGYQVLLFDTSPEIVRRPAPYIVGREGGWLVLPAPPSRKERTGVLNLLRALRHNPGDDLTGRTLLVGMEPERGVVSSLSTALPLFAREAPSARLLGTLVHDPRTVSLADAGEQGYRSPLTVVPHGRFARSVHDIVDALAHEIGLTTPLAKPRSTLLDRLFRARPVAPAGVAMDGRKVAA